MTRRLTAAAECVAWYRARGVTAVSPVIACHLAAELSGVSNDFATWEQWCHDMLHVCDQTAVLCIDGWDRSRGVSAEIELARVCGKPILFLVPERVGVTCP